MTGIIVPDNGTIGSASDTDALTITNTGVVKASQSIATGTIKDATGANNSISIATNGEATFAENIKITASKGIDFSANSHQTGMSSELLDFYEEGTWTATSNGGTLASGSVVGRYTKIGNLVTIHGQFHQGGSQQSAALQIKSLPFTSAGNPTNGTGHSVGAVRLFNQGVPASHIGVVALLEAGLSYVEFFVNKDAAAPSALQNNNSGYVAFTITYTAA